MSWLRNSALHMAALGVLVYGAVWLADGGPSGDRPRVIVPQHRFDIALQTFFEENRRAPSESEQRVILDNLIDQEVLYTYALELGMDSQPAARRRLAKIAEFVSANPHEQASETELAEQALALGLQNGDLIVRRILIDNARRLIRAVVLLQEPAPQLVDEYLRTNATQFERPAKIRITQVAVNGFKWPDSDTRAQEILQRIRSESLSPQAAAALADETPVETSLPLLTEQALERKFGHEFASAVMTHPAGGWIGPVASRYGHHLVYIHETRAAYVPPLNEIGDKVKQRLTEKLADEWLAVRLRELRLAYDIVTPVNRS